MQTQTKRPSPPASSCHHLCELPSKESRRIATQLNSNMIKKGEVIVGDFDKYTSAGIYCSADYSNIANAPTSQPDSCTMLVLVSMNGWIIQIAFSTFSYNGIYYRRNYGDAWSSWHLIS